MTWIVDPIDTMMDFTLNSNPICEENVILCTCTGGLRICSKTGTLVEKN